MVLTLLPLVAFAGEEPMPKLLPPRGELPASFAERFGWLIVVAALVLAAVAARVVLMRFRRVKPPIITAPDVFARRALEALRGQPENGPLLVEVSAIVRRYVIFAFGLPTGEMTTGELRGALASNPKVPPEISGAVGNFLCDCDDRKFSAAPPASPFIAVDMALNLIEKIENARRMTLAETSAPPSRSTAAASVS
jgi:hypothetical protein